MSIFIFGMQILRVCVTLFHQHPEMIDMELPLCQDKFPYDDISSTTAYTSGVTDKLPLFHRVLKNHDGTAALSNGQQFYHMMKLQERSHGHKKLSGTEFGLDISIGKRQMECIQTTNADRRKGRILADAGGKGAIPKISERKIDSLGYIHGHCILITDPY